MADLKPSLAPNAAALGGTERIPATQTAASVAVTPNQLKTFVLVDLSVGAIASGVIPVSVNAGATGTDLSISFVPKGAGQTLFPAGAKATPGIAFTAAPTRGIYAANGGIHFVVAGNNTLGIDGNGVHVRVGQQVLFSAGDPDSASPDVGFIRLGAGVVKPTNGGAGFGQLQCDGSTAAGIPLFGSNSPATSLANPYSWLKFKASDGTQVFVPAWA